MVRSTLLGGIAVGDTYKTVNYEGIAEPAIMKHVKSDIEIIIETEERGCNPIFDKIHLQ